MPDRYWVGGTANWDGTAGTKWSATSGGPGGASVPTAVDDVFFNAASGAGTVTIASGNTGARSINFTGFTGTLTGGATISVAGSVTLVAGMTFSYTGSLTITGTGTLTSAGKSFTGGGITINGAGITVGLGDAAITAFNFVIQQGTFNTNNFNLTAAALINSGATSRTMNLGSSTITLTNTSGVSLFSPTVLNAGTSQINLTVGSPTFNGGGYTYHNVAFTSTVTNSTVTINGINTFNNLSFTGPASAGFKQVQLNSRQIVNGTFSTTGTAGNRRIWFRSATYGISSPLLTINGNTTGLTDADFRDVIVTGTAAPISGTRIGDLRGNSGITFSAPKTVFRRGAGNWSDDRWADTQNGTASTDNFPLAQDTAAFTELTQSGTHTMDSAIPYCGTVDMSARVGAGLTLSTSTAFTVYGNWINGAGTTLTSSGVLTFSGRNTQTITSAGKTFSGSITVDSFGGYVELGDALSMGTGQTVIVTNGTFDTRGFSVAMAQLTLSGSNVKSILLGNSTVNLSSTAPISFFVANYVFNAGTSTINCSASNPTFSGDGQTYHNVSFTSINTANFLINSANVFNNLSVAAPSSFGVCNITFATNNTINGTLTVAGATVHRRCLVRGGTVGSPTILTVGTLVATDCDFRDITIAGAAAGSAQTRAGNCGGNSGITFPAPKTVYWNLAGTQNWSSNGWAATSGGTPATDNFPLAQDTAVFDNAGAANDVAMVEATWNIGTIDASARTTGMSMILNGSIHGNLLNGTGVFQSNGGSLTFRGRGTSTITSNGIAFPISFTVECVTGTVQLADAFTIVNETLFVTSGTFNAVSHNVTVFSFSSSNSNTRTLIMGSGTWTLTGSGTVWTTGTTTNLTFNPGTAEIVLSDNTTNARTFAGGGLPFNKLTIGGNTSTSTTTITGNNTIRELASTKTVAHTIALGITAQTFGRWTVTGTVGNVVTLTGTGGNHILAGACTSGIDYLAMGSIGFASTSPGEFYAGANSTGTAVVPVYRTAKPADSIRYWVGGTGNWSDTARWSASSGGPSGASVPRSHDDVVFNSASNATAYTATVDTITGNPRCKSLTIAGPGGGNLTLTGSAQLFIHNNITLPATGLTRTYTGQITLSGSTTGRTLTTNGVTLASSIVVNGVGCEWLLGSALNVGTSGITVDNGTFDTANFNVTAAGITSVSRTVRTIKFGSSVINLSAQAGIGFATLGDIISAENLTLDAGTSAINLSSDTAEFYSAGKTFRNVNFTGVNAGSCTIIGRTGFSTTFNNLTFTGKTSSTVYPIIIGSASAGTPSSIIVNGTLTFSAGTNATCRLFVRSNITGTSRTITAAAFSGTDVDFRDISVTGAAAPISGTRLGNCRGNSGITFPAAKTVYLVENASVWSSLLWAPTAGGTGSISNFPLAQDTAVFTVGRPSNGSTFTLDASYHIGTLDMSPNSGEFTFTLTGSLSLYGNLINSLGVTYAGTSSINFSGRTTQTITSSGRPFARPINIENPNGTVVLLDAFSSSAAGTAFTLGAGTFNANNFNVTFTSGTITISPSLTSTLNTGNGTWTFASPGTVWAVLSSTNLTITGNATITMTSSSAKTFAGLDLNYAGITLNHNGAGALTVNGNNTFRDITTPITSTSAANISLGTTTQRLTQFRGTGTSGRQLTISGTSSTSPCSIIYTGTGYATNNSVDFLTLTGVRAYVLQNTWYAGNNSINDGTLGWTFAGTPAVVRNGNFLMLT